MTRSVALLAICLAFAVACGGDNTSEPPGASTYLAATGPGPYGVGVLTLELEDTSRETQANGDVPTSDSRVIPIDVWYPADPTAATPEAPDAAVVQEGAPYPLIVFAHGYMSSRRQSQTYVRHLASHGYIVAALDFPLSRGGTPGGPRLFDITNQPGDVSFVIDELLSRNNEDGFLLTGATDGEQIGVTGHSWGGLTTLLTAYGPYRDERVDAIAPLAGPSCFMGEGIAGDELVPALVITGSTDLIVPGPSARPGYEFANAPKYYAELIGGGHVRFADVDIDDAAITGVVESGANFQSDAGTVIGELGGDSAACLEAFDSEPPDDPPLTLARQQELLRAFTTPFFDAYLKGGDKAKDFLEDELPSQVEDVRFEMETD